MFVIAVMSDAMHDFAPGQNAWEIAMYLLQIFNHRLLITDFMLS
jgi:hypothetical protein